MAHRRRANGIYELRIYEKLSGERERLCNHEITRKGLSRIHEGEQHQSRGKGSCIISHAIETVLRLTYVLYAQELGSV